MDNVEITQHILVVDDDPEVCETIERYLTREGYAVHCAADGDAMYEIVAHNRIDLVVLDIRLPKKDGLTLMRELREDSSVPIVLLTARDDVIDRVVGLEGGADDYLPKPFHPRELMARIRAVLRRTDQPQSQAKKNEAPSFLTFDGWRLDCRTHQLTSPDGAEVALSPFEYDLLFVFLQNPNRVLSRDYLLDQIRGRSLTPFERSIDVHISHLRKKLEANPQNPQTIKTIRSVGYIFTPTVTPCGTSVK